MSTPLSRTLRRGDYLLLAAFCLGLFCFALAFDRSFSTHETIHCVNVREMIADGDWVIPHFGDRPWLERPPLPFWITVPIVIFSMCRYMYLVYQKGWGDAPEEVLAKDRTLQLAIVLWFVTIMLLFKFDIAGHPLFAW